MPHHSGRIVRRHHQVERHSRGESILPWVKYVKPAYHVGKAAYNAYQSARTTTKTAAHVKEHVAKEADYFQQSAGGKYCNISYTVPPLKSDLARLMKETYTVNDYVTGRQACNAGRQLVYLPYQASNNTMQVYANAANLTSGGSGGVASYANSAYCHSISCHLVVTNVENTAAELTVLLLRPIGQHSTSPIIAMRDGIDNEGGSATTYLDYDQPYSQSKEFKKTWHVLHKKQVFIMPGETVKYRVKIGVNKKINAYDDLAGNLYDSKYTYQLMGILQGGVMSNDKVTPAIVTSSSATLNWLVRYQVVIGLMDPINVKTVTQPTVVLPVALTGGESSMNEDTAVPQTYAVA